ncbi:hypothetical protein EVAR_93063_1 [Eumeta japonica]|uniref:Uncharacterized protein n=1 Tax=Eumeta variegata TaxID=151549 RepID=A0A4C1TF12_EUMVA|nr:hypothetical protein EVAR_93063_1 [Eumeta japonica]
MRRTRKRRRFVTFGLRRVRQWSGSAQVRGGRPQVAPRAHRRTLLLPKLVIRATLLQFETVEIIYTRLVDQLAVLNSHIDGGQSTSYNYHPDQNSRNTSDPTVRRTRLKRVNALYSKSVCPTEEEIKKQRRTSDTAGLSRSARGRAGAASMAERRSEIRVFFGTFPKKSNKSHRTMPTPPLHLIRLRLLREHVIGWYVCEIICM